MTAKKQEVKETPVERALREFNREYRRVFGVSPTIQLVGDYYRVSGYTDGMSIRRLRELTTQLKHRATI